MNFWKNKILFEILSRLINILHGTDHAISLPPYAHLMLLNIELLINTVYLQTCVKPLRLMQLQSNPIKHRSRFGNYGSGDYKISHHLG